MARWKQHLVFVALDAALWFSYVRLFVRRVWIQLVTRPPIMLFIATVWFGLLAIGLPWLLKAALWSVPAVQVVLAAWAVLHLAIGLWKMRKLFIN